MQTVLYAFLAGLSTVAGVGILALFGKPGPKVLAGLLSFAGGIMIAISFFELLPDAVHHGSLWLTLAGFSVGMLLLYRVDELLPRNAEGGETGTLSAAQLRRSGYLVLAGIGLHNLPEGLAIGAGLEASPQLGLALTLAIALHNLPEGIAIAAPLHAAGEPLKKVALLTLAAGMLTPVGAVLGLLLFRLSGAFVGSGMAFAAGAMVYIALSELLPKGNALHPPVAKPAMNAALVLGFLMALNAQ